MPKYGKMPWLDYHCKVMLLGYPPHLGIGNLVFANTTDSVVRHTGATWRIWWNLCFHHICQVCFLRPTRVHNPNGKSISSAVSAQLTAESPYTLQQAPLSPKLPLLTGGDRPHLTQDSFNPSKPIIQTASWSVQLFLQGSLLWQTDRQTTLLGW